MSGSNDRKDEQGKERDVAPSDIFGIKCVESDNYNYRRFDTKNARKAKGVRKMYIAAFSSLLMAFSTGLCSGYSAPATYDMTHRPDSVINPTEKETMWIGSIMAVGFILGSIIAGPLADKIGRKDSLVYTIAPVGFGWLIICYAESVPVLIFGRLLNGTGIGITAHVVPMYCIEIATAEVRGILGSAFQGFLVIGNLLSVTVGAYISWKYLALHGAIFYIFSVICFSILSPETPRWYLMKNDLQNAVSTMDMLQGGFVDAKKECEAIYKDLQDQPKGRVTWEELKHPTSVKPCMITIAVTFFHQFSGINAVFIYSTSIFEITKNFIDPKIATIIVAAVQIFATGISNTIVDKAGRRILLMISGGLMGISFAIFGAFYYKVSLDISIEKDYGWIPLTCTIFSVIGYSFGYGPLPYLLSAEMLPIRVRSTVGAIVHVMDGALLFLVTNTFSDVENILHNYGAFWFYSSMSAIGVIFVYFYLPETKGKRLEEIQDIFYKKPVRENINISVMN